MTRLPRDLSSTFAFMLLCTAVQLAFLTFGPSVVDAQAVCVPNAIGVPGQPGPPPWWSGSGPMNDPRWQGAMSYGHVNDDAQFRALHYVDAGQKYLVLSWDIKSDSGGAAGNEDYLHVGFWDAGASRGNLIKIVRSTATSAVDGTVASGALTAEMRYRDSGTGTSWDPVLPLPAWFNNDTRLDASCASSLCTRWSVRLRIPMGAASPVSTAALGLPLPDTFRVWYELHVENAGPSITRYKWPSGAVNVDEALGSYPEPTGGTAPWNELSVLSGSCATGISLDYAQITTDNAVSNQISINNPNVFHARPLNSTGGAINGDQIKARFRIANWGSVLFSSPEWIDINPSSPGCAAATGSSAAIASGSNFDLSCGWTLTPTQQCEYRPDLYSGCTPTPTPRNKHQCILVELSSTTGVVFSRASAWNNMNFVQTSKFERSATISINGLPALSGALQRDVYLYVSTQNMPLASEPAQGRAVVGATDNQPPTNAGNSPKPFLPVGTKEGARIQTLMGQGGLTLEQVAAKMPTYIVRVYYDTGERVTKGATTYLVLEPMPSYGYFVMHDGEIEGWKHSLVGATEVAPNFYKIGVPNGGSVEVTNTIESVEPATDPCVAHPEEPGCNPCRDPHADACKRMCAAHPEDPSCPQAQPPPSPWWIWVLLGLVLIAVLVWSLRKR